MGVIFVDEYQNLVISLICNTVEQIWMFRLDNRTKTSLVIERFDFGRSGLEKLGEMVRILNNVWNPNDFVQISDVRFYRLALAF